MTEASIKQILDTERLTLSFGQKLSHYFFVFFILLPPMFTTYDFIQYYILDSYSGIRTPEEMAFNYLWILPAIALIVIQRNRLKFKKYRISANEQELSKALKITSQELNWRIEKQSSNYIRAYRDWDLTASMGEMITIVTAEKYVLINSICDPNKKASIASFGLNRTNKRTFMINL